MKGELYSKSGEEHSKTVITVY